jgi:hypothetical protein
MKSIWHQNYIRIRIVHLIAFHIIFISNLHQNLKHDKMEKKYFVHEFNEI